MRCGVSQVRVKERLATSRHTGTHLSQASKAPCLDAGWLLGWLLGPRAKIESQEKGSSLRCQPGHGDRELAAGPAGMRPASAQPTAVSREQPATSQRRSVASRQLPEPRAKRRPPCQMPRPRGSGEETRCRMADGNPNAPSHKASKQGTCLLLAWFFKQLKAEA